jgi:hypothetical protein
MPKAHRKTAEVMVTPIKVASRLLIWGKQATRHRKYTAKEMIEADVMRRMICDVC